MDDFNKARVKYKPEIIKYLLVAETPPKSDSNRFFYYENVYRQDSLFIETIKVLYPNEIYNLTIKEVRNRKKYFLEKFKKDGFYLIDSIDEPFEKKYSSRQKIELIKGEQKKILAKINSLVTINTRVILIAATVFKANFDFLKRNGVKVINKELVDFPGSGGQVKYREKMSALLK